MNKWMDKRVNNLKKAWAQKIKTDRKSLSVRIQSESRVGFGEISAGIPHLLPHSLHQIQAETRSHGGGGNKPSSCPLEAAVPPPTQQQGGVTEVGAHRQMATQHGQHERKTDKETRVRQIEKENAWSDLHKHLFRNLYITIIKTKLKLFVCPTKEKPDHIKQKGYYVL